MRDRERARFAYDQVKAMRAVCGHRGGEYLALARETPAMLVRNGLGQTLAHLLAKAEGDSTKPEACIVRPIGMWLRKINVLHDAEHQQPVMDLLLSCSREQWAMAEREAILLGVWVKRFAEALSGEGNDPHGQEEVS